MYYLNFHTHTRTHTHSLSPPSHPYLVPFVLNFQLPMFDESLEVKLI